VKLAQRGRLPSNEVFVHKTETGLELRFFLDSSSSDLYWRGEYEPGTVEVFSALCRSARQIFDVGAFGGLYSVFAAAANPDARVLAFEPNPESAVSCRRNLELNAPLTRNVELMQIALGDHDGKESLALTGGTSSLNPAFRAHSEETAVDVTRGDEIVRHRRIERLDLVKLDTESTEPAVLRGLTATLDRDRPDLVCEVLRGRTESDLEDVLRPFGYQYYSISRTGLCRRSRIAGDPTYRFPNYLLTARPAADLASLGLAISGE
jgi:FkbM family methyltransferase